MTSTPTEPTNDWLIASRILGSSSNPDALFVGEGDGLPIIACEHTPAQDLAYAETPLVLYLRGEASRPELPDIDHTWIDDFPGEPYTVLRRIPVDIVRLDVGSYEARFDEANIAISGTDAKDALQAISADILDTYEILLGETYLGVDAAHQLEVLESYIEQE